MKIDHRDNRMAFRRALSQGPQTTSALAKLLDIEPPDVHGRARTLLKKGDVKKEGYQFIGKQSYRSQALWYWTGN